MKRFRQTLGDDIVDWLDSRWGALLKAVYGKKKIAMTQFKDKAGKDREALVSPSHAQALPEARSTLRQTLSLITITTGKRC